MATVVLFHHVQGLTDGVLAFAEQLRAGGHTVHTPDLFEGRTFDTLEEPRRALLAFRETYNGTWLIERHGFRPPAVNGAHWLSSLQSNVTEAQNLSAPHTLPVKAPPNPDAEQSRSESHA